MDNMDYLKNIWGLPLKPSYQQNKGKIFLVVLIAAEKKCSIKFNSDF